MRASSECGSPLIVIIGEGQIAQRLCERYKSADGGVIERAVPVVLHQRSGDAINGNAQASRFIRGAYVTVVWYLF
jgi:hypothetical protein